MFYEKIPSSNSVNHYRFNFSKFYLCKCRNIRPKNSTCNSISPVSVFGKTYPIQVDNSTYNIYYGFKFTYANASKISFVPDHNSIQISLNGVTETDAMWIQFPQNLISAENNNFVLYVDGQERKYELATSEHSTIMGFTVPTNTTLVEIQGTHVVPEFPFLVPILLSSIIFVIAFYMIRFRPT